MTPEKLLQSQLILLSVEQALPKIESAIMLTKNQDSRNSMVMRLARLDQKIAELRDRIAKQKGPLHQL